MARRDLLLESMVSISSPWVNPAEDRPTLERFPALVGSLVTLDRAHEGLLATQQKEGVKAAEIQRLTEQATELDAVHDRKARAVFGLLGGLVDRADDPAERDAWEALRQALFPKGLASNSASYLAQAGNVQLIRARLTPAMQRRLDQTDMGGESLGETVADWFSAAHQLGEVFTRRARMRNEADGQVISPAQVLDARNYWIRVVNNFIEMLELAGVDPETQDRLLTPLHEAESAATRPSSLPAEAQPAEPV